MKAIHHKNAGFTLVEVLAALLVFSVAIVGLSRTGGQAARHAVRLEQKTQADIIADNAIILARLRPVVVGTQTSELSSGGQDFEVETQTTETETGGFFQLAVVVTQDGNVLMRRTAFVTTDRES